MAPCALSAGQVRSGLVRGRWWRGGPLFVSGPRRLGDSRCCLGKTMVLTAKIFEGLSLSEIFEMPPSAGGSG